jgi:hypothetical protein
MKIKWFYQNYDVILTPDYVLSDFIKENNLEDAEIVQMFQEKRVKFQYSKYYQYQIIFKIPIRQININDKSNQ